MHAISSYRGNRPTNTHTHTNKQTDREDRLQYTAPQLASVQCNKTKNEHTTDAHVSGFQVHFEVGITRFDVVEVLIIDA